MLVKESFADILKKEDIKTGRKIASKIPAWAADGITVPGKLALEQCSSSATARWKARFAHGRVADLTGGLGADTYEFSKVSEKVWYNERDSVLAEAAAHNFNILGAGNIEIHNHNISAGEPVWEEALRSFGPDFIYVDPARRDASGKKVFLLEDCSPDVLTLLPTLFDIAPEIMIKLSPMADISMVASRLGPSLVEIQAVGHEGECKELLCLLRKGFSGEWKITATDLSEEFTFLPSEEAGCIADYAREALEYLYEPGPSLMKAGAFKLLCRRFGILKLDRDTQLYFSSRADLPLGKVNKILEILKFDKSTVKSISNRWPEAGITVRNFPMGAEALRSRLRIRQGNRLHIYACTFRGERILAVCEKVL